MTLRLSCGLRLLVLKLITEDVGRRAIGSLILEELAKSFLILALYTNWLVSFTFPFVLSAYFFIVGVSSSFPTPLGCLMLLVWI